MCILVTNHSVKQLTKTHSHKGGVTQMLNEIELSGLITGKMIHQGIHGNTKKFNLTVMPDLVKNTLKSDEIFVDIL